MAVVRDLSGSNPVDRRYCSPNRMVANVAALATATPLYPGEIVRSIDSGITFRALSPATGAWGKAETSRLVTPMASGFPDASNTGPTVGTVFTTTAGGELSTTSNGQVIQNLSHAGYILVKHSNVTIQDCQFNPPDDPNQVFVVGSDGITAITGLKILRCRLVGGFFLGGVVIDPLMPNTEISFCDISRVENGITISANTINIHDNYIHDLAREPGHVDPHFDGVQGFPGPYTNWTINHNTISSKDTSNLITGGANAGQGINVGLTVTNNRFLHDAEISYGMQIKFTDQVTVTDNRISVDNLGGGAAIQRPLFPIDIVGCTNTTISGNVHDETGVPITPTIS